MWKLNASCLSYSLVVMLLFSSLVKSRSRQEATEVDSVVSQIVSSLGSVSEMKYINRLLVKEIRSSIYNLFTWRRTSKYYKRSLQRQVSDEVFKKNLQAKSESCLKSLSTPSMQFDLKAST